MATRPRLGVTGNAKRWSPSWWSIALAIFLAGGRPVRISTRHPEPQLALDALIISGGDDISPEHYGRRDAPKARTDPERDQLEIKWINEALQQHLPLLGICRGAQLINVVLGGTLHQDIRQMRRLTYNRPGLLPTKQVTVEENSMLAVVCRRNRLRVNSLHHQAMHKVGKGLKVVGRDLDQFVQAIESSDSNLLIGVQWHPEYLCYLPSQFALFRWLVKKGK